jgi:hypothetical protein
VRKIKVYPIVFLFEAIIGYVDDMLNPQHGYKYSIVPSLSDKDSILNLLDYFFNKVNELVNIDHPNVNYAMNYNYDKGFVLFQSTFPSGLQFQFMLQDQALKIFNVQQDPQNPGLYTTSRDWIISSYKSGYFQRNYSNFC